MCTSKPKAPKPVPNAPVASPSSYEDTAVNARQDEFVRQRQRQGRARTILAGGLDNGAGQPPTLPAKTALGA